MDIDLIHDLLIVGGGPAGMTAALYALRAGFEVLLIERESCGGKMNMTEEICNYPGYTSILGIELSRSMLEMVEKLGLKIEYSNVVDTNLKNEIKSVFTEHKEYTAASVIIANGLKNRKLGCEGEEKFRGRGVSYCATCDGFFFKQKMVVVVGGGNTALEDAVYLSQICSEVAIFVRKNYFRAEKYLVDQIKDIPNIYVYFETEVQEILGDTRVRKIIFKKNKKVTEIELEGIFVAIGYQPDNQAFKEIITDEYGYFNSNSECETNIPGIFVAGDCRAKSVRQIVTATSDGACAAESVFKYLRKSGHKLKNISKIKKN